MSISIFMLVACSHHYKTNVAEVIELRSYNDGKDIQVQGYVFVEDLSFIRLYPNKASNEYIDLSIDENSQVNIKLKHDKYVCASVVGNFHVFERDSVLVGNISSKYGVIKVSSINECE